MAVNLKYSVIVPVYNSEKTLDELIHRITKTMLSFGSFEILCVDDFSTDNSWKKLISIKESNKHLKIIKFTKNFGQAAATLCGIRRARAETMIVIDDDLQYPPEEIKKLIHHFNPAEKYILFGVPKIQKQSLFKRITTNFINDLLNKIVLKSRKKIEFSTFRILTKKKYDTDFYNEQTMKSAQIFFTMVSPDLMGSVEVEHHKRKKGKSNYNIFKRIQIFLELLLVATQLPIYLFLAIIFVCLPFFTSLIYIFLASSSINISNLVILTMLVVSSLFMFLGFVFLFVYLRKIFLNFLGADAYAIWDER